MINIALCHFCGLVGQLDQQQYGGVAAPFFRRLMERQHVRVLRQPQRRLLLENMFAVPVHHAGAVDVLTFTGGDQRPQLLLGLQLRQPVQIEKQIRHIAAAAQLFQFKPAGAGAYIAGRAVFVQLRLELIGKIETGVDLFLQQALRRVCLILGLGGRWTMVS